MTILAAAAAVVVLAWFAAGTVWNVRKGSALMRWMQEGLRVLGERTTVRWLGSTAVELVIAKANPPFEQVTLVVFLEPRDLPWMWAIARAGGRRDTLIIRAKLGSPPRVDAEALDRASWSGRDALRGLAAGEWGVREAASPGDLATWYRTPAALADADALVELATRSGLVLRRLSVRRREPHFQIHVAFPGSARSARDFFEAFRALGEKASG